MESYSYTKINTYAACPYKYYLQNIERLLPTEKAKPLALGACMASGVAAYRETGNREKARDAFVETWHEEGRVLETYKKDDPMRSVERGIEILDAYMEHYPDEPEHSIKPEIRFEEEILEGVLFRGRIDGVVRAGKDIAIDEDKTASRLGEFYFKQLRNSYQILWYLWIAKHLGLFEIEGTRAPKCLINVLYIHPETLRFERQLIVKTSKQVDATFPILVNWIKQIQTATKLNLFPKADNSVCQMYGGCEYLPLKYAEGRVKESLLKNYYEIKPVKKKDERSNAANSQ